MEEEIFILLRRREIEIRTITNNMIRGRSFKIKPFSSALIIGDHIVAIDLGSSSFHIYKISRNASTFMFSDVTSAYEDDIKHRIPDVRYFISISMKTRLTVPVATWKDFLLYQLPEKLVVVQLENQVENQISSFEKEFPNPAIHAISRDLVVSTFQLELVIWWYRKKDAHFNLKTPWRVTAISIEISQRFVFVVMTGDVWVLDVITEKFHRNFVNPEYLTCVRESLEQSVESVELFERHAVFKLRSDFIVIHFDKRHHVNVSHVTSEILAGNLAPNSVDLDGWIQIFLFASKLTPDPSTFNLKVDPEFNLKSNLKLVEDIHARLELLREKCPYNTIKIFNLKIEEKIFNLLKSMKWLGNIFKLKIEDFNEKEVTEAHDRLLQVPSEISTFNLNFQLEEIQSKLNARERALQIEGETIEKNKVKDFLLSAENFQEALDLYRSLEYHFAREEWTSRISEFVENYGADELLRLQSQEVIPLKDLGKFLQLEKNAEKCEKILKEGNHPKGKFHFHREIFKEIELLTCLRLESQVQDELVNYGIRLESLEGNATSEILKEIQIEISEIVVQLENIVNSFSSAFQLEYAIQFQFSQQMDQFRRNFVEMTLEIGRSIAKIQKIELDAKFGNFEDDFLLSENEEGIDEEDEEMEDST
eukprot:TRINITY_DN3049_c0_g1_i1.p1 TRINITY_DN3049_c0_g1~~TRINITY_DN3049_c0_g1_i1.p1  ORF type:complete len:749 (+),score=308.64 TRINITY_DN3049_c0_g1_i1:301-2247(+)